MTSLHQPPSGFVRRLRVLSGVPDLELTFNVEEAEARGGPFWNVWTLQKGEPHVICHWPHVLDGNLDGLAQLIAKNDYLKNGGHKRYAQRVMDGIYGRENEKRRKFRDWARGVGEYSRDAFRKLAYHEESAQWRR